MESESTLPFSNETETGPYYAQDSVHTLPLHLFKINFTIIPPAMRRSLKTKLCIHLFSLSATCPTHLNLLGVTIVIFGEYNLSRYLIPFT